MDPLDVPAFLMELYDPDEGGAVDMPSLRDHMQGLTGVEPDRQLLVYNHRLLEGNGTITVQPVPEEAISSMLVFERPPDDKEISVKMRFEGEPELTGTFVAGTPVWELKRLGARRYQLAPHRQELTTLRVVMADRQPLAAYGARDPIDIRVNLVDDGVLSQLVLLSVRQRYDPGVVPFMMDARDTFDMLLGKMEKAGMVAEGEELTFIASAGNAVYQNWKTFGDYEMTHAFLSILEWRI